MKRAAFGIASVVLALCAYATFSPGKTPRGPASTESLLARNRAPDAPSAARKAENAAEAPAAESSNDRSRSNVITPPSFRAFEAHIADLDRCQEGGCDYPSTDPRSYEVALNSDLARELARLAKWAKTEKVESEEVSEVARAHLDTTNGFVVEAALKVLASQPPSRANLEAILSGVFDGGDADLVDRGITELKRYSRPEDLRLIDEGLARSIENGAPFVAQAVSKRAKEFISVPNVAFYRALVERLPAESIYRENLSAALEQTTTRR